MTSFDRGSRKAEQRVVAGAERGLARAGLQLLSDAIMESPTCPVDEGVLRGSGSVAVAGAFTAKSVDVDPSFGGESESTGVPGGISDGREITAEVGFNSPYAADTNFTVKAYKEPTAGAFWFTSKVDKFKDLYAKIVANDVREALKRG